MLIDGYPQLIQQIPAERARRVSIYPKASEYEVHDFCIGADGAYNHAQTS